MLLDVQDFHKTYGITVAVRGLSFSLEPGAVAALVGPNGAGKTTTMRAIAGIIPPTAGTITIAGRNVRTDAAQAKQQLAYVPDDPKLFDALTVWEHLRFIAAAYRVDTFEPDADRLIDRFELREKRDTLASELSRGMRQKVAICCAALHRPRVILLDEPLTGLDPRGIRTMKAWIREQAAAGSALLISSHLLALVEDLCDTLLILHRGVRLFFGRMSEARAAFASRDGAGRDGAGRDASLEEVFFTATEGGVPELGAANGSAAGAAPVPPSGPPALP